MIKLFLLLIITSITNSSPNTISDPPKEIEIKEGVYHCTGYTTSGKKYKTLIIVTKKYDFYDIVWQGGYEGIGYVHNNQFIVSWTNSKSVGMSILNPIITNDTEQFQLEGWQVVDYKKTKETWKFLAALPDD